MGAASARSSARRGTVTLFRVSVIGTPVVVMRATICAGTSPGYAPRSTAAAPATNGAERDVPPPESPAAEISSPGASSVRKLELSE